MALDDLSAGDLHSRAVALRQMADSARTADTRDALHRLAARFADLAERRADADAASNGETCQTAAASMSAWLPLTTRQATPRNQPPPS